MKEIKPEAVGTNNRGSNALNTNRESVETIERLNELGRTLCLEQIVNPPPQPKTAASVLGYAHRIGIIHEIEAVARMDGPSLMFPEAPKDVMNIYTNCGKFDPETRICDEIALRDVTRLCGSNFAQLIGFRFISPLEFRVRSEVLAEKLDDRIQRFCRRQLRRMQKATNLKNPWSTSIKVTGITHKLGTEDWDIHSTVARDYFCGWDRRDPKSQALYNLNLHPGLAASIHDRLILDRCANPDKCKICSEGKTHTTIEIPFSNN